MQTQASDTHTRILAAYSEHTSVVGRDRFCVEAAGVYRVIQIANKKPYAAISASRHNLSPEENNKRSRDLLADIKRSGLYAYEMIGGYEETKEDGSTAQVVENSFFVPFDERRKLKDFINLFKELTAKYGQEAFLLGLPGGYDYQNYPIESESLKAGFHYFVDKSGSGTSVGTKAAPHVFEQFGSIVIDPKRNRALEWRVVGTTQPTSVSGRVLMDKLGLRWVSVEMNQDVKLLAVLEKVLNRRKPIKS